MRVISMTVDRRPSDCLFCPLNNPMLKHEKCGKKMVIKSGRFGKFLACPAYPECKNTKPVPEDEVTTPCPKCGSKLIKKNSRKRILTT